MNRRGLIRVALAALTVLTLGRVRPARAQPDSRIADFEPVWDDVHRCWVVLTDRGPEGAQWIDALPVEPWPVQRIKRIDTIEQDELDDWKAMAEWQWQGRRRERARRMST